MYGGVTGKAGDRLPVFNRGGGTWLGLNPKLRRELWDNLECALCSEVCVDVY